MHAPSTAASSHHHADPCCRAHVFTIVKLVNTVLKRQNSMEGRARRHRRRQAVCTRLTAASGRPGSPGDQVAQHYPFSGANHQLASYVWPLHGALSFFLVRPQARATKRPRTWPAGITSGLGGDHSSLIRLKTGALVYRPCGSRQFQRVAMPSVCRHCPVLALTHGRCCTTPGASESI